MAVRCPGLVAERLVVGCLRGGRICNPLDNPRSCFYEVVSGDSSGAQPCFIYSRGCGTSHVMCALSYVSYRISRVFCIEVEKMPINNLSVAAWRATDFWKRRVQLGTFWVQAANPCGVCDTVLFE